MEDKNELSDIVLEKEDNKALKLKRILIIAALLIVIFLVAIVFMKVKNGPVEQNNTPKLNLPPQPITKQVEPKQEDDLFKKVEIQEESEEKKESFEEMVKSLKAKEQQKQIENIPVIEEVKKVILPKIQKIEPKKVIQPKKVSPKITPKKAPAKVVLSKKGVGTVATKGVYVQVGATSRLTPDKKFLSKISSEDYNYRLLAIDIKGTKVTKILIGPYNNTTEAKQSIANIKTSINKDAFIYRVK